MIATKDIEDIISLNQIKKINDILKRKSYDDEPVRLIDGGDYIYEADGSGGSTFEYDTHVNIDFEEGTLDIDGCFKVYLTKPEYTLFKAAAKRFGFNEFFPLSWFIIPNYDWFKERRK